MLKISKIIQLWEISIWFAGKRFVYTEQDSTPAHESDKFPEILPMWKLYRFINNDAYFARTLARGERALNKGVVLLQQVKSKSFTYDMSPTVNLANYCVIILPSLRLSWWLNPTVSGLTSSLHHTTSSPTNTCCVVILVLLWLINPWVINPNTLRYTTRRSV